MPGTSINSIDYNDTENKRLVEEALDEVEVPQQRAPPQQQQQQQLPPQYQQQAPPQYQQGPPPSQYQQGPPPQQYQQGPPQYMQQPQMPQYQQPPQQENFEQTKSSGFSFSLPDALKKTLMLLVILFLINNNSFKDVLSKIPFTINAEGEHTFMMTIVVCSLIALIFFIVSSVF